jgi:hypothetical protein
LKPATLFRLHRALKARKYRLLFAPTVRKKPGPRGPSHDVVAAVLDMKRRNPTWGCPRIAQQIVLAFDIPINKDVVRILAAGYRPAPDSAGPSWLTALGHVEEEPLVFERSPPRFDHGVRKFQFCECHDAAQNSRGDQVIDLAFTFSTPASVKTTGVVSDGVVCENTADGLRGLAVVELEHAAEPLTAPYSARSA